MITLSEKNDASLAEMDFNRSIASAAIDCGKYISPTESDIAEAEPEWKTQWPTMEAEEISNPTKKAVDDFAGIMKDLVGEFEMAVEPNTGTQEDEKALLEYYDSIPAISLSKEESKKLTDAIFSIKPKWYSDLPVMEVEELEVINIELSDYPLPENPTTYDWWWA